MLTSMNSCVSCKVTFFACRIIPLLSAVKPAEPDEPLTGEQFGQKQPPLYVAIKSILERYPDGQIFKVCIIVTQWVV